MMGRNEETVKMFKFYVELAYGMSLREDEKTYQ